jgi:GntR family negative regulator for fad regulon and positive regulator of fabA
MAQHYAVKTSAQPILRPAAYTETSLVTRILDGTYPPNSSLPPERALAEELGVTRPTLRETLQRLGREGWLCIRHGKPTRVNDYWETGGLTLLSTLGKYAEQLPEQLITHLLEFRAVFLPPATAAAASAAPEPLIQLLTNAPAPADAATSWADFDWRLQQLICRLSGNPIYLFLLNDFEHLYRDLAKGYFTLGLARETSGRYYHSLKHAVSGDLPAVHQVVASAMVQSIDIWKCAEGGDGESCRT